MYNMQNDTPSENTLKHLSSHAGFTECHQTSIPLLSEQGECFYHVNYVSKHTHLHFNCILCMSHIWVMNVSGVKKRRFWYIIVAVTLSKTHNPNIPIFFYKLIRP